MYLARKLYYLYYSSMNLACVNDIISYHTKCLEIFMLFIGIKVIQQWVIVRKERVQQEQNHGHPPPMVKDINLQKHFKRNL